MQTKQNKYMYLHLGKVSKKKKKVWKIPYFLFIYFLRPSLTKHNHVKSFGWYQEVDVSSELYASSWKLEGISCMVKELHETSWKLVKLFTMYIKAHTTFFQACRVQQALKGTLENLVQPCTSWNRGEFQLTDIQTDVHQNLQSCVFAAKNNEIPKKILGFKANIGPLTPTHPMDAVQLKFELCEKLYVKIIVVLKLEEFQSTSYNWRALYKGSTVRIFKHIPCTKVMVMMTI